MTDAEKLAMVEYMTGETDQTLLSTYLLFAKQIVLEKAFPYGNFPENVPSQYDSVQIGIAVYKINKRGAEGEIVHLENGISRHWDDGDIPPALLRRIIPFCGVLSTTTVVEEPTNTTEEETHEADETEP